MDSRGVEIPDRWEDVTRASEGEGIVVGAAESASASASTPDEPESVIVADARLSGGSLALAETLEAIPDATFVPDHHRVFPSGKRTLFVSVTGGSSEKLRDAFALDPTVVRASEVSAFPNSRMYRVQLNASCILIAPTSVELGARTLTVRGHDGAWNVRIQFPDREALLALRNFCGEHDIRFGIDSLYQTDRFDEDPSGLTDRQWKALRLAFESGYYEVPRDVTQDDLADKLGVSTSAVSHRLRRATAQLIRESLDELGRRNSQDS